MKTNLSCRCPGRRGFGLSILAGLALLFAGCWQRSLHPFYTEADLVSEPGLAGSWRQAPERPGDTQEDRMRWSFTRVDDRRYDLTVEDDKERHEYEARAFRLGGSRFLDLFAKVRTVDTIPAHHVFRLTEVGASLKVAVLNPEWVAKWLQRNPASLAHTRIPSADNPDDRGKDEFVLTAETAALQRFLTEHQKDHEFFTDDMVLEKDAKTPPTQSK